jgi:hypothetical protein
MDIPVMLAVLRLFCSKGDASGELIFLEHHMTMSIGDPLTLRQKQVLDFIKQFIRQKQIAPTYREMMSRLNIKSPNGIKCHIQALVKKGYLLADPGIPRSLRLPRAEQEARVLIGKESLTVLLATIGSGHVHAEGHDLTAFCPSCNWQRDNGHNAGCPLHKAIEEAKSALEGMS